MSQASEIEWIRCRYFAFHDVPRCLVFMHRGKALLLESPFEEEQDDYRPYYYVWELDETPAALLDTLDWRGLESRKTKQRDDLPVKALRFDPVRDHTEAHRFSARFHFREIGHPSRKLVES